MQTLRRKSRKPRCMHAIRQGTQHECGFNRAFSMQRRVFCQLSHCLSTQPSSHTVTLVHVKYMHHRVWPDASTYSCNARQINRRQDMMWREKAKTTRNPQLSKPCGVISCPRASFAPGTHSFRSCDSIPSLVGTIREILWSKWLAFRGMITCR